MRTSKFSFALVGVSLIAACSAEAPQGVSYVPPTTPPATLTNPPSANSPHAAPPELTQAETGAAGAPAAQPPTAAATPTATAAAPATPPASAPAEAVPAKQPVASAGTPAAAGAPATTATAPATPPANGFDAGSGMLQADGKTVIYHIPDGTGGKDWNPKDKPIRVERGWTLRLIDDDKSTRSGGHWLHTNGQPCPHGLKAIGTGFDCKISANAPMGVVSGTFEHNIANGIGRVYIEVVEAKQPN